jgi:hypothetical protein
MTITPTNTLGNTACENEVDHFQQAAMTAIYDLADEIDLDYGLAVTILFDAVLVDLRRAGDDLCRSYIDATWAQATAAPDSDAQRAATDARTELGLRLLQAIRDHDEAEFQTIVFSGGTAVMQ